MAYVRVLKWKGGQGSVEASASRETGYLGETRDGKNGHQRETELETSQAGCHCSAGPFASVWHPLLLLVLGPPSPHSPPLLTPHASCRGLWKELPCQNVQFKEKIFKTNYRLELSSRALISHVSNLSSVREKENKENYEVIVPSVHSLISEVWGAMTGKSNDRENTHSSHVRAFRPS